VDKSFNGQSWFKLRESYLKNEKMRDREETYAAIRKMLATLGDPFTRFLEPEQYAQLRKGTQGTVTGVGLEVAFSQAKQTKGQLLVRSTMHLMYVLRVLMFSANVPPPGSEANFMRSLDD
jgi:carboxyl-terminal processing protease